MTKRQIEKRIDEISYEMIEADGDTYFELQQELEDLQLELDILISFGVDQLEDNEDLNFNVGNVGAYYE